MSIRINATVQEARTAANHSQEQWDRFYFITKDEARQLAEAHPDWKRWILIPANEKEQMLERINARLSAEGIPPVEMIILKWRVSQLLRDIQRKYANLDDCTEAGSMLQGIPEPMQPRRNPVFYSACSMVDNGTFDCLVSKPEPRSNVARWEQSEPASPDERPKRRRIVMNFAEILLVRPSHQAPKSPRGYRYPANMALNSRTIGNSCAERDRRLAEW
ncbi:hypothetical protein BM1_05987 [Bipolaris maydis]|nr:hypothetical protein BM1_05987 [Bipolaris maydis]